MAESTFPGLIPRRPSPVSRTGRPYAYAASLCDFATVAFRRQAHSSERPRLLDLCCGAGTLASYFAAKGWDIVGTDDSPELLRIARATDWPPKCSIRILDALDPTDSRLGRGDFDLVVAFDGATDRLRREASIDVFLRTSHASLRRGGHVAFELAHCAGAPREDVVRAMRGSGFLSAWPASPIFVEEPFLAEHRGRRQLYIGRRDM